MFTRLGLFDVTLCPDERSESSSSCRRKPCLFSHKSSIRSAQYSTPSIPRFSSVISASSSSTSSIETAPATNAATTATTAIAAAAASASASVSSGKTIPIKRPTPSITSTKPSNWLTAHTTIPIAEPPRKLQKLDSSRSSVPSSSSSSTYTSHSAPVLNILASTSKIPLPVRQACLKNLYDAFVTLYSSFHNTQSNLAHDHALSQEHDIYTKTNKLTYRQGIISSIVSLKKRAPPDTPVHPSVGTEAECQARLHAKKVMAGRVTASDLERALLRREDMVAWGYVVDVPESEGGDRPSSEGEEKVCERCGERFVVTPLGEGRDEACSFHWGRPYTKTLNGEKIKTYKCCAMSLGSSGGKGGCSLGPHVFYEKSTEDLHHRHTFTLSSEPAIENVNDVLDVAAMDCEMIYTTAGMSVGRVSVVDGEGKRVFDEFVRLDPGVKVVDYITRFSGITPELSNGAVLDLAAVRRALRAFIGPKTILVGHALENDLKTLRMVHHRIVDTCVLFPHKSGAPYRRALRDIVSDKLQKMIQTGGDSGHSSVEDAIATLDLVRWWILNEKPKKN